MHELTTPSSPKTGPRFRSVFAAAVLGAALMWAAGAAAAQRLVQIAQSTPAQPDATKAVPAPKPEPVAQEPVGTPATVIESHAAESLLGKKVQSAKGEDLGRIVDVIVDKAGQIRAAVIDFGGFLGVGSRKIAVDWRAVHMPPDGKIDKLVVDLPQDQLRAAPVYKEGEPVVVLGPATEVQAKPPAPAPVPSGTPPPPAK